MRDRRRILAAGGSVISLGLAGCAQSFRNFVSTPDVTVTVVNETSIHRTVAVILSSKNGNVQHFDGIITVNRGKRKTFDEGFNLSDDPPIRPIGRVLVDDGTYEEKPLTIDSSGELIITIEDGVSIEKR